MYSHHHANALFLSVRIGKSRCRLDLVHNSVLESPHFPLHPVSPGVSLKVLLALLLMLNHSLLFGVSQAAYIPDEDHPYGYAYQHEHLHEHPEVTPHEGLFDAPHADHDVEINEDPRHHEHDEHPADNAAESLATLNDTDHEHEFHHTHSAHIPLNCDLPFTLSFTLLNPDGATPASHQYLHLNLAYAPPVPPPNR